MYSGKLTKEEQREKLLKIKEDKRKLEFSLKTRELITGYKEWRKFSLSEQQARRQEWGKYYEQVKESPIYALVQEQRMAAFKKDWGRVKELALQARQMRENGDHITITKPKTIDPFEFDFNPIVRAYQTCERLINEFTYYPSVDEEQKQVWGA